MKSRCTLGLACAVAVSMLSVAPASAAERLCSVYVESFGALQAQLQKATAVFDAPELGMLPMLMAMTVPGASQLNATEPVALHIYDLGGGKTAGIVEVTPATTAEMFMKSLLATSGKPLPTAVNGRYTLDDGAAQESGTRLLLARGAADLDACADLARPPMPALEGVVRMAMAPSAAVPALQLLKSQCPVPAGIAGSQAAKAQEMIDVAFNLYIRALAQIKAVEVGVAVQDEGLVIRKRLAAEPGSTVEAMIGTMTPVTPEFRAFINADSLFGIASGRYAVPAAVKRQITDLYLKLMSVSPMMAGIGEDELKAVVDASVDITGAPMAFEAKMAANDRLLMLSAFGIPNAAAYLKQAVALMETPAYRQMNAASGARIAGPEQRAYKDAAVSTWTFSLDEEALRKTIETQAPGTVLDAGAFAGMNRAMRILGNSYEYAAAAQGLAFGMGSPAMVERAVDRLQDANAVSGEAARIQKLLSPTAAPAVIGRLAIVEIVRLGIRAQHGGTLPEAVQAVPAGEGIAFADWVENGDIRTALLIPAVDVKALRAMAQAMKPSAANSGE